MPPSFGNARKRIDEASGTTAKATVQQKAGCGANANGRRGCGYRCRCGYLFSTIRYWRRNDRMGTLIRHAGRPASPILALSVAMIQLSFRAALMTAVGCAALSPPGRCTTGRAAVSLPAVTVRTNEEQHGATGAQTKSRPQNCLAMQSHAPGAVALTMASPSWEVKTSFDVWLTFHEGANKPEPRRYERRGSLPSRSTSTFTDDD